MVAFLTNSKHRLLALVGGLQGPGGYLVGSKKSVGVCLVQRAPSKLVWGPGGYLGDKQHKQGVDFLEGVSAPGCFHSQGTQQLDLVLEAHRYTHVLLPTILCAHAHTRTYMHMHTHTYTHTHTHTNLPSLSFLPLPWAAGRRSVQQAG